MTEKTTTTADAKAPKDKAGNFKKLAEKRVSKALAAIAVIGNLASKANYEYSDEQVAKIEQALNNEVTVLMNRFRKPDSAPKSGFSL